uniref:Uncharacterized protein n=1 Tax=Sinocyclocheilus rhinocerous TaxID=307959 RepID=A0A673JVH0_9TELE
MATMVGGPSEVKQATAEVQKICDEVRLELFTQHHFYLKKRKTVYAFWPFIYTTMVLWGIENVNVGGDEFVHLRVHKSLPHSGEKLQLHGIQMPKAHQDPIEYF